MKNRLLAMRMREYVPRQSTSVEQSLLALVCINAYRTYLGTLHGCSAPVTKKAYAFYAEPRPGDLVIETTTIYDRERDAERIGRLLRVVHEPLDPAEPEYVCKVWCIEGLDGSEYRWHNASFIRVAESLSDRDDR
jgi:hypothetical protein